MEGLIGKSHRNGPFSIAMFDYQRVHDDGDDDDDDDDDDHCEPGQAMASDDRTTF